jgi:hypothetical protein
MKKQLLLGAALIAAMTAFPQATSKEKKRINSMQDMSARIAERFARENYADRAETQPAPTSGQVTPQVEGPAIGLRTSNTSSIGAVNWNSFTGSMNMYGVLVSGSRPLQYDDELNAVTFVHRKSATYVPSPVPTSVGATTGVLNAMVSQNWGTTWDSTMIYNDNNNWARYPQGGILKNLNGASPSNTNIANAYIVATAPITSANTAVTWIGNIVTTKALGAGTYNNVQAAASQTFISSDPPYAGFQGNSMKMDFLREGFTSTDDGKVRALSFIVDGGTGTAVRGSRIVTGSFNSGTLLFTADSLIPPVRINPATGARFLIARHGMAWSEDGQVGYVYFIGAHTAAVGSTLDANRGYQPIIATTTNGGISWAWQSIDFNQPSFKAPVLDRMLSTALDPTLTVPFMNFTEGTSAVVDSAKNLHLVSALFASSRAHDPDSIGFTYNHPNYDGETYSYPHQPGFRPYLYDFRGGFTGTYSVTLIDSLSSEGPSGASTGDGYGNNPWLADATNQNAKIEIDSRIQVSSTTNGRYIVYSWAETDTTNTPSPNGGFTKWNYFPNIKARMMDVKTGSVSVTEINVSTLRDANNQTRMSKTSYNHYISSKCAEDLTLSTNTFVVIRLPHTISFNSLLNPTTPATHRYASVPLEFRRLVIATNTVVGVVTNGINAASNSYVYPNPANSSAFLAIDLKNNSNVKISVINVVGQIVKTSEVKADVGANMINIDLNGLSKGVYLVNVTAENATATKKLIIE